MLVHDIVRIVQPGLNASFRPGRTLVDFREDYDRATLIAVVYNRCRYLTDGHEFVVETHDEECPGRASDARDPINEQPCTCKRDADR